MYGIYEPLVRLRDDERNFSRVEVDHLGRSHFSPRLKRAQTIWT